MTPIIIGEKNAHICLIQPVDEHDASFLEKEYALIRDFTDRTPFVLAAFQVDSWNTDLSPWEAPAVFGKEGLGDREEKAKNPVMSTVGDCIRTLSAHYEKDSRLRHILEWNEGNHFKDADLRTAKAFAWCINTR